MQSRCRAYGLSIGSAWPIPGAMTIARDEPDYSDQADIEILEGSAACERESFATALRCEQRGVGRYFCEDGKRIVVTPCASVREYELLGALIATALPAALWMRGEVVLHAASVLFPEAGRAIAIAGPSGSGKSTILKQLVAAGASVVGDDTLCARLFDQSVQVSGLPGSYFLRRASSGSDEERQMCPVPREQQLACAELGTLLVLDTPRASKDFGFRRLRGTLAMEALLRNRHRPWVPQFLRSEGVLLPKIARFLERVAVYSWIRCEGAQALDAREMNFLSRPLDGVARWSAKTNGGIYV